MHITRRLGVMLAGAMLVALSISPGIALAADEQHGIGFNKGCVGSTKVGDPYQCSYGITNNQDGADDTLTITSLVDVVNRPGSPSSGNILQIPGIGSIITFEQIDGNVTTNASCSGLGTAAAICTLPAHTRIRVGGTGGVPGFSFYTIQPGDYTVNANHRLTDTVGLIWQDTCSSGTNNCPEGDQLGSTGSSTLVVQLTSATTTDIHNAAHQVVTAVAAGSTVHDFVTVTGEPGKPFPGGNVNIDWFLNGTCTLPAATNSGAIALTANGTVDATDFAFIVNSAGLRSFRAHYEGNDAYLPSDGACEPLQVVDARIKIEPNATNEVGQSHTFTATLETNTGDGTGFQPAAGEHVDVSLVDAGGATHGAPTGTCTAAGPNTDAAGHCSITFSSSTTGTVTGHATASLTVAGVPLTVSTDGTLPNSGDAVKTFVNANIGITPATANNPVGTNHVLTLHVNVDTGDGTGFHNAPAGTSVTASIQSGPGSFVGSPTCLTVLATGECTVTITSATAGTTVVRGTTTVSVGGINVTRTTGDSHVGDSADANKLWADDTVTTQVHNPTHQDITNTTVAGGTVVHDRATVARTAGTPAGVPNPTGTVTFTLYNTLNCTGTVVDTDANVPLGTESKTFTTPNAAGTFSYRAHYNGDANYAARDAACEPFSVEAPPTGQITPTQVDCSDVRNGTAPSLAGINYSVQGGKIGQNINPGVFFYWTKITTTVPNQVVTVSQSNTSTNNAALFTIHQGYDRVYTGNCSSYITGTEIAGGSGATFTIATPGNYILGIKYQTKSIAGTTAPVPANIIYNFATSLGGNTGASVPLLKQ